MSVMNVIAEVDFTRRRHAGAGRTGADAPALAGAEIASALLAGLAHQADLGVALCNPDGVLTMVNDALGAMLGHDTSRHTPRNTPRTMHGYGTLRDVQGNRLRRGTDPLSRALRGERVDGQVLTTGGADRPLRAMKCTAFPLLGSDAAVLGAALIAADVTDAITERRHLEDLRDELVGAVNHEVRTPLAVITGHIELIGEQTEPEPESLSWSLSAIGRATSQLGAVVDNISEIADGSLRTIPEQR